MSLNIKINKKATSDTVNNNFMPELPPKSFYYIYYISSCSPYAFPGDLNDPNDNASYVHNVRAITSGTLSFNDP